MATIPVVEEELEVGRRSVTTARVRVRKTARQRTAVVNEPVTQEEVVVQHVAVNRPIPRPAEVRREGTTLIVPVMEEVLVVQKQLILKEELHITTRRSTSRQSQAVTLTREEVQVERIPESSSSGLDPPGPPPRPSARGRDRA